MRYLLLIYLEPAYLAPEAEVARAMNDEYREYTGWLQEGGMLLGGEALQDVANATSVAVRDGRRIVTDGPFAETKEHLAGYYLVEAAGSRCRDRRGRPDPRCAARDRRGQADPGARLSGARQRGRRPRRRRPRLPRGLRPGARDPDPGPGRLRPRGGGGRRRVRGGARALAGRRDPRQPGRVDHHDGPQPGHRPGPAGAAVRGQGRAHRARCGRRCRPSGRRRCSWRRRTRCIRSPTTSCD